MRLDRPADDTGLRARAIKRLMKRRDLRGQLVIYTLVNLFLVATWATTMPGDFFWPIFPIVGWGVGVVLSAWDVHFAEDFSEEQIAAEVEHLRRDRVRRDRAA